MLSHYNTVLKRDRQRDGITTSISHVSIAVLIRDKNFAAI